MEDTIEKQSEAVAEGGWQHNCKFAHQLSSFEAEDRQRNLYSVKQ